MSNVYIITILNYHFCADIDPDMCQDVSYNGLCYTEDALCINCECEQGYYLDLFTWWCQIGKHIILLLQYSKNIITTFLRL